MRPVPPALALPVDVPPSDRPAPPIAEPGIVNPIPVPLAELFDFPPAPAAPAAPPADPLASPADPVGPAPPPPTTDGVQVAKQH